MHGPTIILILKIAVAAVTCLLLASITAVIFGRIRLHGRINIVFFALTVTALVALEVVVRVIDPAVFDYFTEEQKQRLFIHLCFSVPAAFVLPLMLFTGLRRNRRAHLALAGLFGVLWVGTFVTGIFFL